MLSVKTVVCVGPTLSQTLREDAKRFERKMRDQVDTVEALEDAKYAGH